MPFVLAERPDLGRGRDEARVVGDEGERDEARPRVAGREDLLRRERPVPGRDPPHLDPEPREVEPRRQVRRELRLRRHDDVARAPVEPLRHEREAERRVRHDGDRRGAAELLRHAEEPRRGFAERGDPRRHLGKRERPARRELVRVPGERRHGARRERRHRSVVHLDRREARGELAVEGFAGEVHLRSSAARRGTPRGSAGPRRSSRRPSSRAARPRGRRRASPRR